MPAGPAGPTPSGPSATDAGTEETPIGATNEKPLTRSEIRNIIDYIQARRRAAGGSGGVWFFGTRREMAALGALSALRLPKGQSVDRNVRDVRKILAGTGEGRWFDASAFVYSKVRIGGDWDWKNSGGARNAKEQERFAIAGNFNFGAVAHTLGVPVEVLLRVGGAVQSYSCARGGACAPEGSGSFVGSAPYGDLNGPPGYDGWMIQLGAAYERYIR